MNLTRIVLAAMLTVWLAAPGAAQSPASSGGRPVGVSQPGATEVGSRSGATKQRQSRRSETAEPQVYDPAKDAAEDARLTRILNICRGC
jgi:hypothetical protein